MIAVDGAPRMLNTSPIKSGLGEEERSKIVGLAESYVNKENIIAIATFGPEVGDYLSFDSQSGIIIVTKNLKMEGEKKKSSSKSSTLIVNEKDILAATRRSSRNEPLLSRFLTNYESIVNEEFLHHIEVEFKKRVMVEELLQLQIDYDYFSSDLIIPFEYFLFSKLHDIALLYPEELDSFVATFGCPKKEEIVSFAIRGFQEAARSLSLDEGVIEANGNSVRLFRGKKRSQAFFKLLKMYPLGTGRASKYALHELAMRFGFGFKTKPLERQKSLTGKIEVPVELDRPKKLLRLPEGVVFDDSSKMIEEIAQLSRFPNTFTFEEKKKGELINSSSVLEIRDSGNRKEKFVIKDFRELKSAKWLLLNIFAIVAKRFNRSPLLRLDREVKGANRLQEIGIKTHQIVGVAIDAWTLVTEFVEGEELSKTVQEILEGKSTDTTSIEKYGGVLGKLHKAGIVYGDTKPQNVLVATGGGIALLDLEQTVEGGDEAWDLAEFLYFSATRLEQDKKESGGRGGK
ncbi:MAG: lipopolysaccharide kinase InaA family protein, partial [Nitrososphaerales archaeon]